MERFATEIRHRHVRFRNAVDAVRFSYRSEDSIAYLNLNLCEYSSAENNSFFVSTEEKCRKIFSPSRSLFYNLNLDLAEEREYRLNDDENPDRVDSNESIQYVGRMEICWRLYTEIMSGLIKEAIKVTEQKEKILRLLLRQSFQSEEFLFNLEPRVVNDLIGYFYPEVTDTSLFELFFRNFNLTEWTIHVAQPEMLEYLLRQSCLHARDFNYPFYRLIDDCIKFRNFLNIRPILKRASAPEYSEELLVWFIRQISLIRPGLTEELLDAVSWMTEERICLVLQIIWMFEHRTGHRCAGVASNALRLIWSSIPDACISFEELKDVAESGYSNEEIIDIYHFYYGSVGETHNCLEPRTLKHLCRITVRRILSENNVWIPDGISLMGLTETLEPFVNLSYI